MHNIQNFLYTYRYAQTVAKRAGLPAYKFAATIRKKCDRDKLHAKPCPECRKVCV